MVYTPVFRYPTFLQSISKTFQIIKDIDKPLLRAKFQTDWLENMSDSKSISDSGVWCNKPESEFSPRTRAKSTYFDFNTLKSNLF